MLAIILVLRDLSKEERIFPIPSFVMLLACSAPCPPPEFCEQFKKINFGIVQFTITFSFFGPFPASLHCFCAGSYQSVLKKYSTKAIVMRLHQSLLSYSILSVRTSDLKHTDLKHLIHTCFLRQSSVQSHQIVQFLKCVTNLHMSITVVGLRKDTKSK